MRWLKINNYKKRAYRCEYTNYDLFDEWAKDKGITHWEGIHSNYTTHFPKVDGLINHRLFDHVSFFKNDVTKETWLISQPYCEIDNIRNQALEWCEANNMTVEFFDTSKSWYYPGESILLVFKHK